MFGKDDLYHDDTIKEENGIVVRWPKLHTLRLCNKVVLLAEQISVYAKYARKISITLGGAFINGLSCFQSALSEKDYLWESRIRVTRFTVNKCINW